MLIATIFKWTWTVQFSTASTWPPAFFYDICLTFVAFDFVNPNRNTRGHKKSMSDGMQTRSGELTERVWKR